LGRADIVAFLTRLGHLEQTETVSANRRLQIVRHVRTDLRDARDLGMTRAGGCAAGLPGEFGAGAEDIPPPVQIDGPGRALPNEVMNALNDALPLLETRSGRAARVAVEVLMDTGRRPDEICQLPWTAWTVTVTANTSSPTPTTRRTGCTAGCRSRTAPQR
jgi:hypothetical protein